MFAFIGFIAFVATVNGQYNSYQSDANCNSAYCSSCNSDPNVCTSCINNYMLIDGKCVFEGDKNCRSFSTVNGKSICSRCNYGYKFDFNTGSCVSGEEQCDSPSYDETSNQIICEECEMGYALLEKGCKDCTATNQYCIEFESYKTVEGDICGKCKTCSDGYAAVNGVCHLKYKNVNYEGECKSGYVKINGYCHEGHVDGCKNYRDSHGAICDECMNGGVQEGDECTDCDVDHCITCVAYSTVHMCETCEEGYFVGADGECYSNPANCKTANNDGTCYRCNEGYIDNDKGVCVKCGNDCARCSSTDKLDYCTACIDENKFARDGKCVTYVEGCSNYKEDGSCSSCYSGYKLEGNRCLIQECLEFDTTKTNKCIECNDGYFMKEDFTCGKCDASCEPNGGCVHQPTMCIDQSIEGCIEYNEKRNCVECYESMELVDGECHMKENFIICMEYLLDGESCGLCAEVSNYDEETETGEINYYWPDSDGTCGAGSVMMYLALLLAILVILF